MTTAAWALTVSILSAVLAAASFAWNVWSKFIFPQAAVRVSFQIMKQFPPHGSDDSVLALHTTNFGPGAVTVKLAAVTKSKWPFRKRADGILKPINNFPLRPFKTNGPFSGGLPRKLEVGEEFGLYFPFDSDGFLTEPLTGVGVVDTLGRLHWASSRDVKKAKAEHKKAFAAEAAV